MVLNNDIKDQYNSNNDQNQGGDLHLIYLDLTIF